MKNKKIGIIGSVIKGNFADVLSADETYIKIIEESNNTPIVLPMTKDMRIIDILMDKVDGIILQDGPNISPFLYNENPKSSTQGYSLDRDFSEIAYIEMAIKKKKSILALCRGMHMVNVFFGGSIIQSIDTEGFNTVYHTSSNNEGSFHYINIEKESLLHDVFGNEKTIVYSNHTQGINELGSGLDVVAKSDDGIIEGIKGNKILGIQFNIAKTSKEYVNKFICRFVESVGSENE